jgi:hypothetical protein
MENSVEHHREQCRLYAQIHQKDRSKYMKGYRIKNKGKIKKQQRKNNTCTRIRNEIISLLGKKCSNIFNLPHPDWCNDLSCLQIDHVNDNGHKERTMFKTTYKHYEYILQQIKVGSKNYQLLCANCNWIKRDKRFREFLN